jgi:hypothetical protein
MEGLLILLLVLVAIAGLIFLLKDDDRASAPHEGQQFDRRYVSEAAQQDRQLRDFLDDLHAMNEEAYHRIRAALRNHPEP